MDKQSNNQQPADGFSESWLTLREPADHAARNRSLSEKLARWATEQENLQVVELGAGTGSTIRYLMPELGHRQSWLLIDNDISLLEHLPRLLQPWMQTLNASIETDKSGLSIMHANFSATIQTQVRDLAADLNQIPLKKGSLLTASALLDLTSATWLEQLAKLSVEQQCACLFVLNYNGAIKWQPETSEDTLVSSLLNQHQLNDKGFGKALGPSAGDYFATLLETLGRDVSTGGSDWLVNEQALALQQAIVDGWAEASIEQNPTASEDIRHWHSYRCQAIGQHVSRLTVGHIDVLSLP